MTSQKGSLWLRLLCCNQKINSAALVIYYSDFVLKYTLINPNHNMADGMNYVITRLPNAEVAVMQARTASRLMVKGKYELYHSESKYLHSLKCNTYLMSFQFKRGAVTVFLLWFFRAQLHYPYLYFFLSLIAHVLSYTYYIHTVWLIEKYFDI